MNYRDLNDQCYRMSIKGGYVLAFATAISAKNPGLDWQSFRNALLNNGHGFCGYAESAIKHAFDKGRKP